MDLTWSFGLISVYWFISEHFLLGFHKKTVDIPKQKDSDEKKGLKHAMKKTFSIKGGSKKFTSGSQQIFDSVVNASYTKYEKQEIPPIDLKVAEMHSMMLVMYEQIAKLEEKLISAGENKNKSSE